MKWKTIVVGSTVLVRDKLAGEYIVDKTADKCGVVMEVRVKQGASPHVNELLHFSGDEEVEIPPRFIAAVKESEKEPEEGYGGFRAAFLKMNQDLGRAYCQKIEAMHALNEILLRIGPEAAKGDRLAKEIRDIALKGADTDRCPRCGGVISGRDVLNVNEYETFRCERCQADWGEREILKGGNVWIIDKARNRVIPRWGTA